MANSSYEAARGHVADALAVNRRCVRASILLGDVLAAEGRDEEAVEAWKRVENQDPEYLSLVGEKLTEACSRLGRREQGQYLLRSWLEQNPSLDLLEQVFRGVEETQGAKAAYDLVRNELKRNPTLLGLEKLLEAAVQTATAEQRGDVELVRQLIHAHTRRVARYRCNACGFKARQFMWHCPACGGWETYPPRRTEEFDLMP